MGLVLADELHRPHLGGTAQRSGRERVDEGLHGVGSFVELARHTTHEVDDVAVVLKVLVEVDLHVVAVAAEVVAGEVDQHHVLGVFLGVLAEEFGSLPVGGFVAGALCCPGNGVDIGTAAVDAAVCLGTGTKNAETSEVEVEEIRRGIDAAKSPIQLEVVAFIALYKPPRQHDLEDIASQAVGDALTDVGLVLFVGDGRTDFADGMEIKGARIVSVEQPRQVVECPLGNGIVAVAEGDQGEAVVEMVEGDDVAEEDVEQVGGVVALHRLVLDGDVFEIPHRVERGIAVESAHAGMVALDVEP